MADQIPIVNHIICPVTGAYIVDMRSLPDDVSSNLIWDWHNGMTAFLKETSGFGFTETCMNQEATLGTLQNMYIDYVKAETDAGRRESMQTFEQFAEANWDASGTPDYVSKPWLETYWFGIRTEGFWSGALMISNVMICKSDPTPREYYCGWPVVVHDAYKSWPQAEFHSHIIRAVMDQNFVTVGNPRKIIDFVEWNLPTHPDSRYVARGSNTYGSDVFQEMANGVKVHFKNIDSSNVPTSVAREVMPGRDPNDFVDYAKPGA